MKIFVPEKYSFAQVVEIPQSEIEKIDFAHCAEPAQTLAGFYNSQTKKPKVIVNGGFFATDVQTPVFNYISNYETISYNAKYQWGIGIDKDGKIGYGSITTKQWKHFLCGYPVFIDGGKDQKDTYKSYAQEINYSARRTLLGFNKDNVYLVTVNSPGLNFTGCVDLLLSLKVEYAINLDGGGSSNLLVDGTLISETQWQRPVDNVVAVWVKEEAAPVVPDNDIKIVITDTWYQNNKGKTIIL